MKIYNVIWKDRHRDTTAEPFLDLDVAINYAIEEAKAVCRHPEFYAEKQVDGRLFHVVYSCDGDCIWITEHEVYE